MINLTGDTRARLLAIFRADEAQQAERVLTEDCGETVPSLGEPVTPVALERIRFAALRVSGGNMQRLHEAITLAHTDWRDLLVNADFAKDIHAHKAWNPRRFNSQVQDAWMAGSRLDSVDFHYNDDVEVVAGTHRGEKGDHFARRS